ncbi:MAG: phosphatidylglycerophosphatase A [Pseudomonadota bacterium]
MALTPEQRRMLLRDPAAWIAAGGGAGFFPFAPGTVGSLVALPLYLLLQLGHPLLPCLAIGAGFAVGTWAAGRVIARLGVEDPGVVVIDEFVGQWLALALVDLALWLHPGALAVPSTVAFLAAGVLLFRICDLAKPWPASWADRALDGGFGAMLDDLFAGLWAGALLVAALAAAPLLR